MSIMSEYKETELGLIPKDWDSKKLEESSDIVMGQSPKSESYNDKMEGMPLIQGNADCVNRKTFPRTYTSQITKTCSINDIIMTVRAPVGAISKAYQDACIGRGVCAIKTKNNFEPNFIYQYLISYEDKWASLSQGSTFTAVNSKEVRGISIPVPPLPEQKKIALILSTMDNHIDEVKGMIGDLKELKKGLMQKLLTEGIGHTEFKDSPVGRIPAEWEVKILREATVKISIGLVTKMTSNYCENGVPLIRNSDIKENRIKKEGMINLTEEFANENDSRRVHKNDIVTVHTGDIGTSAVIDEELDGAHGFATLNTTVNDFIIDPNYLCWYFNSEGFKKQAYNISTGDGRNNLNLKDFIKTNIPVPKQKEEQYKITKILNSITDRILVFSEEREELIILKKGLMQQLLTGKTRVKVD